MTSPRSASSFALNVLAAIALVAALYMSRSFVVPVLIGVLVTYALSPVVDALARWRVPRALASLLVIGSLIGGAGTLAYQLSDEAASALRSVPDATSRLRAKAEGLVRHSVVSELQSAADSVAKAAGGGAPQRRAGQPLPVKIVDPAIDVKGFVLLGWRRLFDFGSQALLVAFLAFFMLSSGDLFRRKLVRLAGARLSDRRVTVELLDEVGGQISRFLLHQVLTGSLVGLVTWLAFRQFGLEYAALWGI